MKQSFISVFFCFATSLLASDDTNFQEWKNLSYSKFKEQFSLKNQQDFKNWESFKEVPMKKEKSKEGKEIAFNTYERTLFKDENHEIIAHAEKDKNGFGKSRSLNLEFQQGLNGRNKLQGNAGITVDEKGKATASVGIGGTW